MEVITIIVTIIIKEELRWEVAEKVKHTAPLYLRLCLYWSGQVQVRYVDSTTYYLLPTTYYRLPTIDYRL